MYLYEYNYLTDKNYSKVNELLDAYINNNIKITNPGIYNLKAQALYEEQKYDEALNFIEKSLELNPDYCYALNTKANILDKMGKKEEALVLYQKASELNPDNIIFLLNYSLALLEDKKKEKSKEIFDKAEDLYNQGSLDNKYNKSEIEFIEKNVKELIDKFKKIKVKTY